MTNMFGTVLILTSSEINARRDKHSVAVFEPLSIKFFGKGADAFDFMSNHQVDLVLCDGQLNDMDGVRFLKLLRQNMNLKKIPVVMVTMENKKNRVLDCISAGCTGYILRPYSMDTFERHIKLARNVESFSEIEEIQLEEAQNMVSMGEFDDAIEAFEEIIAIQDDAQKFYDMGCNFLFRRKYGKAIIAFKKAVKLNDLFAEAYKGLADAYKGKGDMENCYTHLKKAAEIHAQFDRLEETKALFIEILKYESEAPNPFNTLGVRLRREGDYVGALHAYDQAVKITPEDENIYFNKSKAYYFMGDLEQANDSLVEALKRKPDFVEAGKLYKKINKKEWASSDHAGEQKENERPRAMVDAS